VYWGRDSIELLRMIPPRKSISSLILRSFTIDDLVTQAKQLSEDLLLPRSMKALLIEMYQTVVVSVNHKFRMKQIVVSLFHCQKNSEVLFFINR